jgi:NAD(P)-dependent dehydrogenase (short-subunit alcohol dehydrogenase family)
MDSIMTRFLEGRLALVTGASRGIGAACAEVLAGAGAHVILTARTAGDLEQVEQRIHETGGSATIAPLDLAASDGVARLAGAVRERWEALDILVLNAAILGSLSPASQIEGREFNRVLTLNVLAQQALIAAFDPMLRRSDNAALVAVTSSVGRRPRAYWGAYGASKAALETLVLSYAEEVRNLAPVRVAILDPGATATQMRALAYPGEDAATLKQPAAVGAALVELLSAPFDTGHRLELGS